MIKCNNCGAKNSDNAKVCAVCGKEISSKERYIDTNVKNPWYGSTWFIILMVFCFWPVSLYLIWKYKPEWVTSSWFTILWLIFFPPVGFYLMWKNKKFSYIARIIITIAISAFWIWLIYKASTEQVATDVNNDKTTIVYKNKKEEIGNIEFKIKEYFDVRVKDDDVYDILFYPERTDAQASLGFILIDKSHNAKEVKDTKDSILNEWKKRFNIVETEEEMRGNNYLIKNKIAGDNNEARLVSITNDSTKETVLVILSVDNTDTSGYSYFSDFENMIQNIKFLNNNNAQNIIKDRIDYYSAEAFESDLNAGKNLEGKKVLIVCRELHPDSVLGYNIYAGEHINIVSNNNPGIKEGEEVLIKTKKISKILGNSWKVEYELLDKDEYDLNNLGDENSHSNANKETKKNLLPIEEVKTGTSYNHFYLEVAKAAIVYAISNYNNLEAFNEDGHTFNMSKMKPYGEKTKYSYSVFGDIDDVDYEVIDNNTLNIKHMILKPDYEANGSKYQAVKAKVSRGDNLYELSDLQYLVLSGKEITEKDEEFYGWVELTKDICPMMVVDEIMLQNVEITYENGLAVIDDYKSSTNVETKKSTKKKSIFDDPDVKMNRFIDSMCKQQYEYGYKISGLSVTEVSEGVLDGKCSLRVKNSSGVWGNYSLHCVADFNKEKLITWDVY